ncbi:hypothetical protein FPV67DRAFT_1678192 [Lyophyllum atratum]|nr:hypothetical protein FPV67DRAFT_1678192 [Lyophyllum atratum]
MGSVFIDRSNVETTDPNSYVPPIARQMADHSPDVPRAQAAKLFIKAAEVASYIDTTLPVVVIIDRLDETDPTRLSDIVHRPHQLDRYGCPGKYQTRKTVQGSDLAYLTASNLVARQAAEWEITRGTSSLRRSTPADPARPPVVILA